MVNFKNLLELQAEFTTNHNKKSTKSVIALIILEAFLLGFIFHIGGEEVYIVMGVLGGILLLLIFTIILQILKNKKKMKKIDESITQLSPEIQQRIEEDCKTGYRLKNFIVCRDCLLSLSGNATAISYDDIVFVYPSATTHRIMLIPFMTANQIVILDNNHKDHGIDMGASAFASSAPLKKPETIKFYEEMLKNAPWILFGANNENLRLLGNFKEMVKVVEERHIQWMMENEKK